MVDGAEVKTGAQVYGRRPRSDGAHRRRSSQCEGGDNYGERRPEAKDDAAAATRVMQAGIECALFRGVAVGRLDTRDVVVA